MATRVLLKAGHRHKNYCPVCAEPECKELFLTPEYLRYRTRSKAQQAALTEAMDTMTSWPLDIYGANPFQGDTRNLSHSLMGKEGRWSRLIQEKGAKLFIDDHVQQYNIGNTEATDYEKQLRAIGAVSDVVAQWHVACLMLSQVSLTSQREHAADASRRLTAAGGNKGAQEANAVFSVDYTPDSGFMKITIEESRKSATFSVYQKLEDTSGSFYGQAAVYTDLKVRQYVPRKSSTWTPSRPPALPKHPRPAFDH